MAQKDTNQMVAAPYHNVSVAGTAELVQTGDTLVSSVDMHNTTAADAFLQMFNAAAAADVTVGTTVPDYVIVLPTNGTLSVSYAKSLHFPLGLVIASTTAVGGSTGAAQNVSMGIL